MKLKLFSNEATELIGKKKRKGKIEISYSNFSTDGEGFVKGQQFISVHFDGYQEGSASPCLNTEEADKCIENLKKQYENDYILEIIDKRGQNENKSN